MSNSDNKMSVVVTNKTPWGKRWAVVEFSQTGQRWIPSFEDLYRIVRAIAFCEDEKYPPEQGFEGRGYVARFLHDSVYEADYDRIAEKYKLPIRDGETVIKTNGAKLAEYKGDHYGG